MGAYNTLYQKILVPNIMLPLGMQGFIPLSLSLLICGALRGSQWCLQLTTKQYPLVFSYAYDIQKSKIISAGIHCHYFSPKCYMPLLPSTQSVSFSFYCHTGTMVEHKLLIKLSGLFRREHQKPSTQILRNGV